MFSLDLASLLRKISTINERVFYTARNGTWTLPNKGWNFQLTELLGLKFNRLFADPKSAISTGLSKLSS